MSSMMQLYDQYTILSDKIVLYYLSICIHVHTHTSPSTHTHTHTNSHTSQTMSTVSSKAVGPMGSLTGPGANRASVLRAAYQQQYKMKFTQASSSTLSSTSSLQQQAPPISQSLDQLTPSDAAGPPKKKRKSRWD